ncbi:hypothetical protein TKK_0006227 [Trichogramma kaykai]
MKFLAGLFGDSSPTRIGRQYMKVGKNALFGPRPKPDERIPVEKIPKPLNLLVSQRGKFKHKSENKHCARRQNNARGTHFNIFKNAKTV